MIYINGEAVSPLIEKNKPNLYDSSNAQLGNYNYTYNGTYGIATSTTRFVSGKISVDVGKAYDLIIPSGIPYGLMFVSNNNLWKMNTGWRSSGGLTFVATEPYVCFVVEILNGEYDTYKKIIKLQESDVEVTKVTIDDVVSNWTHLGISHANGRSFTEAKSLNTDTSRFRYDSLISTDVTSHLVVNTSGYSIAILQYDDEELGRADSGWIDNGTMFSLVGRYDNLALVGKANSSTSIDTIVSAVSSGFQIYKVMGVTE